MSNRKGFTLIEVVVAISLLAIITTMVWQNMAQTFKTKEMLEESQTMLQEARVALSKMEQDIAHAFLSPAKVPLLPDDKQPWVFIGNDKTLRFTSMTHQRLFKNLKECDQNELEYLLEEDKEDKGTNLVRKEYKRIYIERDSSIEPEILVLTEDIHSFKLRYCDGEKGEWVEEWDTTKSDYKDKLPIAVEITIAMKIDKANESPKEEDLNNLKTIAFIERVFIQERIGNRTLSGCSDEKLTQ